jgi:GNAT superfamily N-acetyltransferase
MRRARRVTARLNMIETATPTDCTTLTEIAFSAKGHWGYPRDYMDRWSGELTITADYVTKNMVRKEVLAEGTVAFYSIVRVNTDTQVGEVSIEAGTWLDHMFVKPAFHKRGIGGRLVDDMKNLVTARRVNIFVDPNAEGFYRKMGATLLRQSKSSIPGRLIPVYTLVW